MELLNVVRPTAAVAWFVAFSAHALHRWPGNREPLASGDIAHAAAFAHEVRRFYPFAPFLGGRAVTDLTWRGEHIPAGCTPCRTCTGSTTTSGCGVTRTRPGRGGSWTGRWNGTC